MDFKKKALNALALRAGRTRIMSRVEGIQDRVEVFLRPSAIFLVWLAFIGTALRLGLNKALYRGNTFLAFDEPTEAMTEDNSRQLVSNLAGTAEQVLVITHKDTDQGLAANLLEI